MNDDWQFRSGRHLHRVLHVRRVAEFAHVAVEPPDSVSRQASGADHPFNLVRGVDAPEGRAQAFGGLMQNQIDGYRAKSK
jgi:hypothetical protein